MASHGRGTQKCPRDAVTIPARSTRYLRLRHLAGSTLRVRALCPSRSRYFQASLSGGPSMGSTALGSPARHRNATLSYSAGPNVHSDLGPSPSVGTRMLVSHPSRPSSHRLSHGRGNFVGRLSSCHTFSQAPAARAAACTPISLDRSRLATVAAFRSPQPRRDHPQPWTRLPRIVTARRAGTGPRHSRTANRGTAFAATRLGHSKAALAFSSEGPSEQTAHQTSIVLSFGSDIRQPAHPVVA